VPSALLNRLKHYFLTYKNLPDDPNQNVSIEATYGADEAKEIIKRSVIDYENHF
jgi:inorganic pyrophosphatase